MSTRSTRFFVTLAFSLAIAATAACGGDDGGSTIDAATAIDGAGGSDGGDLDAAAGPSCSEYCTTITANCTAANLMYGTAQQCMATCMRFAAGTSADSSGNTLGCRITHANNAAGNADLHCRHAGPGGDGVCGANCEGFCTIVLGSCSGAQQQFGGDMGTCMTACAGFATTPPYVATETSGDSFACRLYHATAAAADPVTHCGHVAVASPVCQN